MINEDFKQKIENLPRLIINYSNYGSQLDGSLENKIFDFSVILFWKLFMLFVYEKIQQVRYIIDEDVFTQKWNTIFKAEKYDIAKYDKKNLYAYNQLDDDEVINFLNILYPIDSNFLKKLKSLKQDRHTAGHVCDPTLANQENDIVNFLREICVIFQKLQEEHRNTYISPTDFSKFYSGEISLSNDDKDFLIAKLIDSLPTIPSFEAAKAPLKFLEKNLESISIENQKKILVNSLKNGGMYNQIIESSSGKTFFNELFKNGKLQLEDWEHFYIESTVNNQFKEISGYHWLGEELLSKGFAVNEQVLKRKQELFAENPF